MRVRNVGVAGVAVYLMPLVERGPYIEKKGRNRSKYLFLYRYVFSIIYIYIYILTSPTPPSSGVRCHKWGQANVCLVKY